MKRRERMAAVPRERLDILVFEKGLCRSREEAKALIMEGRVLVDGEREDKPGSRFSPESEITIKGEIRQFVSRGGKKLAKAIKCFDIQLSGRICMDAGCSTGGFTDCMLQNGAAKVYSVDVGYGQLDWTLRNDERVVCMEKTNIRYLGRDSLQELPDFVSIDVSFISLSRILPNIFSIMADKGEVCALIKPQFEAGREKVGKKGVVRDRKVHEEVISAVIGYCVEAGFSPEMLDYSPIKGPEGNIEYLIYMKKGCDAGAEISEKTVKDTVEAAHTELDK